MVTPGSGGRRRRRTRKGTSPTSYLDPHPPELGKTLTDRQAGQPAQAIAVAWTAQQRLHRTWARLEARGKRRTIIAVAAARELAGFFWAITQIE